MTFDELDNKFEDIKNKITAGAGVPGGGDFMVKLGNDALAMIKRRIQESGEDAEGGKFDPYSTDKMYVGAKQMNASVASSFFGPQNNKKHDWVTIKRTYKTGPKQGKKIRLAVLEGGYKKFRELHGRQTGYVDFTFSGAMWGGITIISTSVEHNAGIVRIGSYLDEVKHILKGNAEKRGPILKLNREELGILTDIYKDRVKQFFI